MNVVRRLAELFYVASATCVALKTAPYVSPGALGLNVCPYMESLGVFRHFCIHILTASWVKMIQRNAMRHFLKCVLQLCLFRLFVQYWKKNRNKKTTDVERSCLQTLKAEQAVLIKHLHPDTAAVCSRLKPELSPSNFKRSENKHLDSKTGIYPR